MHNLILFYSILILFLRQKSRWEDFYWLWSICHLNWSVCWLRSEVLNIARSFNLLCNESIHQGSLNFKQSWLSYRKVKFLACQQFIMRFWPGNGDFHTGSTWFVSNLKFPIEIMHNLILFYSILILFLRQKSRWEDFYWLSSICHLNWSVGWLRSEVLNIARSFNLLCNESIHQGSMNFKQSWLSYRKVKILACQQFIMRFWPGNGDFQTGSTWFVLFREIENRAWIFRRYRAQESNPTLFLFQV